MDLSRLRRTNPSLVVRIAVWSLLATVVAFASGVGSSPESIPLAPASFEMKTIGDALVKSGASDSFAVHESAGFAPTTDAPRRGASATGDTPPYQAATLAADTPPTWNGADKVTSLPAWRWNRVVIDADTSGWLGALKEIPVVLCTLFFLVAQFLWSMILGLLKFAFDAGSLVAIAAPTINSGAAAIGRYIMIFSILFWAVALWKVLKMATKGNTAGALRSGFVFVILFALTFSVSTQAKNATGKPAEQQVKVAGTLPWMAEKAASFAGSVTGQLSIADDLAVKAGVTKNPEGLSPTCTEYIGTIHSAYQSGNGNKAMVSMSKLWEQTQYRAWGIAMFGQPSGSIDLPGRSLCHYAEAVNQTPAIEQQLIASKSYPGIVPAASTGQRYLIFGPHNEKDLRRATIAWSACAWNGSGWQATTPWKGVWRDSTDEDAMSGACGRAFSNGTKWAAGTDDPFKVYGSTIDDAFDRGSVEHREEIATARYFVDSFSGGNISDRLFQGILAMLVACLFLYVLGFIAIGMVAAQLMLIVLLILAPLTLTMYAMGSRKANGLLKLTGTTAVSQAFFGLILTALIVLSGVFQGIAATIPAAGFIKSLITGFAPIAAFYIIQRILKSIGMADIMKPTGAMSFMASAALIATGDSKMQAQGRVGANGKNAVQNTARRAGLSATNNALKGAAMGRSAGRWSRGMATKDGRADRKRIKADQTDAKLEERRNKVRDSYAKRLDSKKQTKFAKLANWASERSLGDDRLSRTMLRAAEASDRLGQKVDPSVQSSFKNLLAPGESWYDQRLLPKPGDADGIKVGKPEYQDQESAKSKARLLKAKMDAEIRRDPASAPALQMNMMNETFDSLARNSFGADFEGFSTGPELAAAKLAAARSAGVGYNEIALSSNGLVVPMPGTMDRGDMRNLPTDELKKFVYWLPESDRKLEDSETPDMYAARMTAIGIARGLLTPDGAHTDVFERMGFNLDRPEDAARVEAWQNGQKDAKLDRIVFRATDSAHERRLIEAARTVMQRNQTQSVARQTRQQVVAAENMVRAAETLPSVSALSSENVGELNSQLSSYASLLGKIDSAKARPDATPAMLETLDTIRIDSLKDIEKQFSAVRDALYTQVHETVGLDIDASVAVGQFNSEAELSDKVLGELEAFAGVVEKLEQKLNGIWMGDASAVAELASMVASVSDDVEQYTGNQIKRTQDARSAAYESITQRAATVRRNAGQQRLVAGRDLAKQFQAVEFPS